MVIASAPGKLILIGEHAAVYGCPAVVAAVGLRCRVWAERAAAGVELDLPDIGCRVRTSWEELAQVAEDAREAWDAWRRDPTVGFAASRGADPAHLVKVALGEAAIDLTRPTRSAEPSIALATAPDRGPAGRRPAGAGPAAPLPSGPLPSLALRIESEVPVGSGFGSSAATSVALIAAALAACGAISVPAGGGPPGAAAGERVGRLALAAERRQHGLPSGVDHAAVLRGGVIRARSGGDDGAEVETFAARADVLDRLRIFDSGQPAEPTGAVVAAVRRRLAAEPEATRAILARMEETAARFSEALRLGGAAQATSGRLQGPSVPGGREHESPLARCGALVRDYEACLEELGVVPEAVRRRIRRIEAAGGAAKISGAGALSGEAAGSMIVLGGGPAIDAALTGFRPMRLALGAPGLSLRSARASR